MPDPLDDRLRQQNPWWYAPDAMASDHHLRRYREGPVHWDPPALDALTPRFGDTHTLRGPRQVGKTTTLKRLGATLLDGVAREGRRVLYYSFDVERRSDAIIEIIRRAKALHPTPDGPWYLFLDEIASVPDWQYGVKHAWDSGLTRDDALVLTASSAHDLRVGAERLPGRRGEGEDFIQLPMSFRDFCQVACGITLPGETVAVEEYLTPAGRTLAATLYAQQDALARAASAYLTVGGFPAAVRDYVVNRAAQADQPTGPRASTVRALWHALTGDLSRLDRDPVAALKLMQQIGISLGSPLTWTAAAEAMGVDSPMTARAYVEHLAEAFALLTVYFWDIGRQSLEPRKQRKVYLIDPLVSALPRLLIPGTRPPNEDGLIENAVAVGLFRSAASTITQAAAVPGAVGYWRSTNDREIDFIVPRTAGSPDLKRFPVEVKGDNTTNISAARHAIRTAFGEGLIVSRTRFDWAADVPVLPLWITLAALREQPIRSWALA